MDFEIKMVPEVESIEIKYYKGIKKAKMTFKEGINAIVGENATGKSTVLQAIEEASFGDFKKGKCKFRHEFNKMDYEGRIKSRVYAIAHHKLAFLIDEIAMYSSPKLLKTLKELTKDGSQVIMTSLPGNLPKGLKINIISSDKFQLRRPQRDHSIWPTLRRVKK
jgi:ABC-type Mn2+/Zn2+ transport system ATPase subunit